MDKFKVDILMITYNHQDFIEQAIDGVIIQNTNFKFRLQIFDDCSTDKTEEKIRKKLNHSNSNLTLVYHRNESNLGMTANGKKSFDSINSQYVALCEGDDYWIDSYKLQKQVDLLESTNSDFCYTDFHMYYQEDKKMDEFILKQKKGVFNETHPFLCDGNLSVATWLIRTDAFSKIDVYKYVLNDKALILMCEIIRKKFKIVYLPDSTSVYRKNLGSVSNKVDAVSRYKYHKSLFSFFYEYQLEYYKDDDKAKNKVNVLAINILAEAFENADFEFINNIQLILEKEGIFIKHIVQKIFEGEKYKNNYESLANSRIRRITNKFFFRKTK